MNCIVDIDVDNVDSFDKISIEIARLKRNKDMILKILSKLKKAEEIDSSGTDNHKI